MRANFGLVAHPRGVYHGQRVNALVSLTFPFSRWETWKDRGFVANLKRAGTRRQSRPALTKAKD